MEATK